jgi:hypothetical protein
MLPYDCAWRSNPTRSGAADSPCAAVPNRRGATRPATPTSTNQGAPRAGPFRFWSTRYDDQI